MDFIISFFRDTLDGTTYVIVCSVSAVLLCACIGYLADKKSKKESSGQVTSNEQTQTLPEQPATSSVAPEPIENIGVVENPVSPQPENITMPVEGTQQPVETSQPPLPSEQSSPIAQPAGNIENEVLGQATNQTPTMPEQIPTQNTQQPSQVTSEVPQEQPIFPPVDNGGMSPVGITPTSVEATAPMPQIGEQLPQEQPIFSQATEQTQPTSPVIGENINPNASQTDMANANPNLTIPQEGIAGQVADQTQQMPNTPPLPNETSPSMETANLDMPQMPVEGTQQPVQAETLDNIADATEQIEEEQVIDNPRTTAVTETPAEQPVPQEGIVGQVEQQQAEQSSQAVAPQNIETGNNPQTIGQ